MTVVKNTTDVPLPLPGNIVARPGVETTVPGWDVTQHDDVVRAWMAAGALVIIEPAKDEKRKN